MIVFWVVVGVVKGAGSKDPAEILLNLTFTFGFVPPSGIVWGGGLWGRSDILRNISGLTAARQTP